MLLWFWVTATLVSTVVLILAGAMAIVSQADSGRMYSWRWDSHISPKNSRWLKENLTGSFASETDPRTPEIPAPIRALFDLDELQKDALGLSSTHFHAPL